MSEINDLLNPNEKILWQRIKVKNVVLTYPIYIASIILTLIIIYGLIYPGILELNQNMIFLGYFSTLSGIVLEIFFLFSMIYINKKWINRYRKILNVPKVELKEYKIINVISNQRVIIKDIRGIRAKKRFAQENSISNIKFDKDYLFLDLKKVVQIIWRRNYHQIGFLLDKTDKIPLMFVYFDFIPPFSKSKADLQMKEVMEILNKNFILEVSFENEYITKYNFSLK